MTLPPQFSTSPYAPLIPEQRRFPADGDLFNDPLDFIVRTVWIVETKGRSELDLPQKMARLHQWCVDATAAEAAETGSSSKRYDFVFVDQVGFEKHNPQTFAALAASFTEYR